MQGNAWQWSRLPIHTTTQNIFTQANDPCLTGLICAQVSEAIVRATIWRFSWFMLKRVLEFDKFRRYTFQISNCPRNLKKEFSFNLVQNRTL